MNKQDFIEWCVENTDNNWDMCSELASSIISNTTKDLLLGISLLVISLGFSYIAYKLAN